MSSPRSPPLRSRMPSVRLASHSSPGRVFFHNTFSSPHINIFSFLTSILPYLSPTYSFTPQTNKPLNFYQHIFSNPSQEQALIPRSFSSHRPMCILQYTFFCSNIFLICPPPHIIHQKLQTLPDPHPFIADVSTIPKPSYFL